MKLIIDETKTRTKLPQILRAALKLFVEKGIDGTTTKDIAGEAGVSEGALYRHFKGKDDLAWFLFQANLDRFTEHLSKRVFSQESSRKRIHAFVSECFSAFDDNPDLFRFLILSEHREFLKYPPTKSHPGKIILKLIRDGMEQGEIRAGDPYVFGSIVLGGIIRMSVVRIHGGINKPLRTLGDGVAEDFWRLLANE